MIVSRSEVASSGSVKTFAHMLGIHAQVIKERNFRLVWQNFAGGPRPEQHKAQQVMLGVVLQINERLGGTNWRLTDNPNTVNVVQKLRDARAMFVGIDVARVQHRDGPRASFVALVTSTDDVPFNYHRMARCQDDKHEQIDPGLMKTMIKEGLAQFTDNRHASPDSIVVFRNVVSLGQTEMDMNVEVEDIRQACEEFQEGYSPPILLYLVVKRGRERIFRANMQAAGDNNRRPPRAADLNVPPGTVCDIGFVDPQLDEFGLVSHSGIQGTSRMPKYQILLDEIGLSTNEKQALPYYLCFAYSRCNKPVSIPAPAFLAHKYAVFVHQCYFGTYNSLLFEGDSVVESGRPNSIDFEVVNKLLQNTPQSRELWMALAQRSAIS
jgi:hypothetical protein